MKSVPKDKKLYNQVKKEAKEIFDVWPSAYASGWVVKEYKRRGGEYTGRKSTNSNLARWYKEKWIDVCHLPKKVPCGREDEEDRKYPYCRPSIKVNKHTPTTASELNKEEITKLCKRKRKDPRSRVLRN